MFEINESIAYLIGLLTGKGYLHEENSVYVEFNFNREFLGGIGYCPLCGYQATGVTGQRLDEKLKCKNEACENNKDYSISPKVKTIYPQGELNRKSIINEIIPFLKEGIDFKHELLTNPRAAFLRLEIKQDLYSFLRTIFLSKPNFRTFDIPAEVSGFKRTEKVEFVNGLLDTIGFANAGSWLMRSGNNTNTRMRLYFQVINQNYRLPISIDNFLREHFNVPIQTLDWGHPNIRDGNLEDYSEGKRTAFGREHQLKIFPEYMTEFSFRNEAKRLLNEELLKHNRKGAFDRRENWYPSSVKQISYDDIKPNHPNESNALLDQKVRGHVDAFWQINLKMGCKYVSSLRDEAEHKDLFEVTGNKGSHTNPNEEINKFKKIAQEKYQQSSNKEIKPKKEVSNKKSNKKGDLTEKDTYDPLCIWLKKSLNKKTSKKISVFDTSSQTILNFSLTNEEEFKKLVNLKDLQINPDVIGISEANLYLIESKITAISIKDIGQLIGYCQVAEPEEAYLVSTKDITDSVMKAISSNKEILKYGRNKSIKLGKLINGDVTILKV